MICTTTRKGQECFLMTKNGCSFLNGTCLPIVQQCEGCQQIVEFNGQKYCKSVPDPSSKWGGQIGCNLATHITRKIDTGEQKKINPLKASKKSAKGGGK